MSAERPILIVDDDAVLRETLADQLAVDGEFTAISASPPPGASPRLVVLPTLLAQPLVRMPQLSG